MALTYTDYLDLEKLLTLQQPRSSPPEHDETLFIVIHQTYELWFKQIMHELDKVKRDFSGNDLWSAVHTFKRVRTILKTLVTQVDVLETMTPMSFSSFRDRLETASGFQSAQFRELEFLLGYKRSDMDFAALYGDTTKGYAAVQRRLHERSLIDHFYEFLIANGVTIPAALTERDIKTSNVPDATVQAGLLKLYKSRPELAVLFEMMTDFD